MDRDIFAERLRRAAHRARDFTQTFVDEALPAELRFRLELNASHDGNPLLAGEHLFPADSDPSRQRTLSDVDEAGALAAFWRDGSVPEWIDLSVVGETGTATLVGALTCGRFTADDGLLYHEGEGYAPFHVVGPSLPGDHVEGRRFSIYDSVRIWENDGLQRAAQHAERVRALELCGAAFDDAALARLPAFPNLKVLGLSAAGVRGPGLAGLAGLPALETLHLHGLDSAQIEVRDAPFLAALRSLIVAPAPGRPWGIGHWLVRLPRLEWLQLSAPAALFLDGSLPRLVSLSGTRLLGEPRLCEQTESLSLGFPEMSEAEIEALLAPVRAVETLSLDKTAVGDTLAGRLARRFDLHRLNVRDTKVTAECLRELRAEHPRLRTQPRPPSG
jgi:hypothetical protein